MRDLKESGPEIVDAGVDDVIESDLSETRDVVTRVAEVLAQTGGVRSLGDLAQDNALDIASKYGLKVQGLVDLMRMKTEFGLEYVVPEGFAVPVAGCMNIEIKKKLYDLMGGKDEPFVVLVRSSSPDEQPGKYETLPVFIDPKTRDESFYSLIQAYQKVVGDTPKAVVIQKMAARKSVIRAPKDSYSELDFSGYVDKEVLGESNRSFFVQSHSYLNPNYIQIAVVRGLATQCANQDGKPFLIDVERQTGEVKMVLWLAEDAYKNGRGERQLRQEMVDFYDPGSQEICSTSATDPFAYTEVFAGDWDEYLQTRPLSPFVSIEDFDDPCESVDLELNRLIAVVQQLSEKYGKPFELEGAFVDSGKNELAELNLFQIRPVEERISSGQALSEVPEQNLIGKTQCVIGVGRYHGDLVVKGFNHYSPIDTFKHGEIIGELDKKYGETPYIIFTNAGYGTHFWRPIKNNKIRVTSGLESMSCHNIGLIRSRVANGEKCLYAGFDDAINDQNKIFSARTPRATFSGGEIKVFANVTIESNGAEAQLYFEDSQGTETP